MQILHDSFLITPFLVWNHVVHLIFGVEPHALSSIPLEIPCPQPPVWIFSRTVYGMVVAEMYQNG